MMEAQFPMFFMIALAVGAGLLAVFVLWLSKHIANEKTRAQGVAVAAITVGVLVLGLLVTRSSDRPLIGIHAAPTGTVVEHGGGAFESGVSIESGGRIHVHANHQPPPVQRAVSMRFAWGPLTIGAIAVAVIVLLVTSRKGLAAALAGLGIVGAILLMILFAARHGPTREVAEIRMRPLSHGTFVQEAPVPQATPTPSREATVVIDEATDSPRSDVTAEAESTSSETIDESKAKDTAKPDDKSKTERRAAAETSPTTAKGASKTRPPDWVDDEPTMDAGVYRAVVISGPYSTKRECEQHLDEPLRKAMIEYAEAHLPPSDRYFAWFDSGYVRNNMIEERHLAEEQYNVAGKMYNLYVRLKVEPRDVARFNAIAQQSKERRAVEAASLGGAFVFSGLFVLYGCLRFVGRKKRGADTGPTAASLPTTDH